MGQYATVDKRLLFFGALVLAIIGVLYFLGFASQDEHADSTPTSTDVPPREQIEAANQSPTLVDEAEEETLSESLQVSLPHEPGIETFIPLHLYEKYVGQASAGDVVATAILIEVLKECQNLDADDFVDRMKGSALPQEAKDSALERFYRCRPLTERVEDVSQELDRYSQEFADSQHPLFLVRKRGVTAEYKSGLLTDIFLSDFPEPFLYERAYLEAATLHREYLEYEDKYREEAWTLIYCEANLRCDSTQYRDELVTTIYQQHQYQEILDIETSLRKALVDKDPALLGF